MISDASLIANYDVKRCYEVEITFYYQIQGGLTSSTINNTRKTFSDLLSRMSSILSSLPECSNVTVTRKDIINSLPGVRSVFFRIQLIFTASTSVPDYEVSKRLTVCISTLPAYKQFLDSSTPKIKQGNISYSNYNLSSISNKTSCCCGDIPPPCCAVGSIRINSTKCGKLPTTNNQHSDQTWGMRKLNSFGQPCAGFPRKILTGTVKTPLPLEIHENELKRMDSFLQVVCQGSILFLVIYVSVVLQTPIRTNKVKVHARSVQEENKHLEKQEWLAIPAALVSLKYQGTCQWNKVLEKRKNALELG